MDPKDKREIEEIIALFEASSLSELEVEKEGIRVRLKKEISASSSVPAAPVTKLPSEKEEKKEEMDAGLIPIKTPMVGTFYRSSSPESPPFVEEGEVIETEQVVCIIEAMKLMNEIKSEAKGKIVKILVEDGHPVEYGQTLFLIKKE